MTCMHEDGSSLKGLHQVRPVQRKRCYLPFRVSSEFFSVQTMWRIRFPLYAIMRIKTYTEPDPGL
jgi:hypothetical protein